MKIGTNAGHTLKGPGSGAVGILNESNETRNIVKELNALLKAGGHTVVDCTIDSAASQNAYLQKVVEYANRQDLDYFISVHLNKTKGAKGTEVYTYEGRQFEDALEVCKNIADLGFVNRGVKNGTGLYVVKRTKAKSMLIEVCFVDEPDASTYKKVGAKKIAEAIYKAIVDTNIPKPSKPVQEQKNYLSKGDKNNEVKTMQTMLIACGYSCGEHGADGEFGSDTDKAVRAFQKDNGLEVDGKYGINSKSKLVKLYNISKTPSMNYYKQYLGKSLKIDEVLKAIGVSSKYYGSWQKRKVIANTNGIKNYTGTEKQNKNIISLAKQGKLKKA